MRDNMKQVTRDVMRSATAVAVGVVGAVTTPQSAAGQEFELAGLRITSPIGFQGGNLNPLSVIQGVQDAVSAHQAAKAQQEAQAQAARQAAVAQKMSEFINRYEIKKIGHQQVELNLQGGSRVDFLVQAEQVSMAVKGRSCVELSSLQAWAKRADFQETSSSAIRVEGMVPGSTGVSQKAAASKGWNNVDLPDLAVAQVAYSLLTDADLFGGSVVRAKQGGLTAPGGVLREASAEEVGDNAALVCASRLVKAPEAQSAPQQARQDALSHIPGPSSGSPRYRGYSGGYGGGYGSSNAAAEAQAQAEAAAQEFMRDYQNHVNSPGF